jgi:hypothetical protein
MYAAKHRGRGCVMIASLPGGIEAPAASVPVGSGRILAAFVLLALLVSGTARAQEPAPPPKSTGPQWSSAVQVMNQYVWRGFLVNDRPVVQPEVRFSWKGAELSTWSNLVAEDRTLRYYEHDLALGYEHAIRGRFSWNAGYTYYAFVQDTTDRYEHEFSLGASYDGPVSLGLTAFQTVAPIYGTYYLLEAGRTFQFRRRPPLIVRSSLGYNHRLWITDSLFSDATVTASTRFSAKQLRFEPMLSYSAGLDRRWFGRHLTIGLRISHGEED